MNKMKLTIFFPKKITGHFVSYQTRRSFKGFNYSAISNRVKERDDNTCQCCDNLSKYVHHIIFRESIFDVAHVPDDLKMIEQLIDIADNEDNLNCLCETCHSKIHKKSSEVESLEWFFSHVKNVEEIIERYNRTVQKLLTIKYHIKEIEIYK